MRLLTALFAGLDRLRARWQPAGFFVRHLRAREKYRPDYDILAASLLRRIPFTSVLDVGCANGFLLQRFVEAGKTARGIDRSPDVLEVLPPSLGGRVEIEDFSKARGQYDLVCCVEVAEHLPPDRSVELVEKLLSLAKEWIFFSAAPPGQFGLGHINSRPQSDWLRWFAERHWSIDRGLSEAIHQDLRKLPRAFWLRRNGLVLRSVKKPERPAAFEPRAAPSVLTS